MDKIKISGMSCQHCVGAVTKALEEIDGLTEVSVDLDTGEASFVNAGIERSTIQAAINQIGFDPGE
ncbi:heavy-metal-associated domain-containing protein [Desulforhopalus sp. 52FAK]